ncbi:MAG: hypothetical protein J1E82_07050 [Muribaculaceae bacterium]|nr:hypothetical protein [Muribaculaceae bacterium]
MRYFPHIIFLLLFLLGFSSCKNKFEQQLDFVEKIAYTNGDESWKILTEIDTTKLTEKQKMRLFLHATYIKGIYASSINLLDEDIKEGDSIFSGKLNSDEIKWNIVKSFDAKQKGDPVGWLENLKDAEFLAIQLDRKAELGFIYLYLSKVYQQGFNGTVGRYYAEKARKIFEELNLPDPLRDARMSVIGSIIVQRDYKTALDSMEAMIPDVMDNATESYKSYFLDQLARTYDENDMTDKAISIWQSIYDDKPISSNTLAHWANAYLHINKLDSALILINEAIELPHNNTDEYLCRNVQYQILEKGGQKDKLPQIDSLRQLAATGIGEERKLEESSLSLNVKYDSATRDAWIKANNAKAHTLIAIFVSIISCMALVIIWLIYRKRNKLLKLEHENDILKIHNLEQNLFLSDNHNKIVTSKITSLFQSRFNVLDDLAVTYFECKDTGNESKRIYNEVKEVLNNFNSDKSILELTEILNGYHNNLMMKFKSDFPKLSKSQYRLAVFLFCGFSLPSISLFMDTELKNIYVYKSRLKSLISKSDSPNKEEYLSFLNKTGLS